MLGPVYFCLLGCDNAIILAAKPGFKNVLIGTAVLFSEIL